MWQDFLNQVIPALIPLLSVIITGLASFLTYKINAYIQKLKDKSESQITLMIIDSVVAYVDQVFKDATNEEKLAEATKNASQWLASKGIIVSDVELRILIESAVNAAHKGLIPEVEDVHILEEADINE